MRRDRRMLLAGLAAGGVAAGAFGWWRASGHSLFGAGPYSAWKDWRGEAGQPARNLLHAGILASNPHNAQPWLFRLGDDRIEVIADPQRAAGNLDPYFREVHLGLGCAIENMALAAPANGLGLKVQYASGRLGPNLAAGPAGGPAAVLMLDKQQGAPAPAFDQIPNRHTNRGPYDPHRAVPQDALDALGALATPEQAKMLWLTEPERRQRFGTLLLQATRTILKHPTLVPVWERWLRPEGESHQAPDGIPFNAPLKDAGVAWVDQTQMQVSTAPVIGVLALEDPYDLTAVLRAGRAWQRIHLAATARGLAAQPMNQILWRMEYEENLAAQSPSAPAVYDLLNAGDYRPALFFRLGYAKEQATVTPRRPLQEVVLANT